MFAALLLDHLEKLFDEIQWKAKLSRWIFQKGQIEIAGCVDCWILSYKNFVLFNGPNEYWNY